MAVHDVARRLARDPRFRGLLVFGSQLVLYLYNGLVAKVPFHGLRLFLYRRVMRVGRGSSILMDVTIRSIGNIEIGDHCVVNAHCVLDGRGGKLTLHDNVDVGPYTKIWTREHDPQSPDHAPVNAPVTIERNCWVSSSAVILPGVRLAEGTVVAAGAVVTRDTASYTIVGGVPAKRIGERRRGLTYRLRYRPWFE